MGHGVHMRAKRGRHDMTVDIEPSLRRALAVGPCGNVAPPGFDSRARDPAPARGVAATAVVVMDPVEHGDDFIRNARTAALWPADRGVIVVEPITPTTTWGRGTGRRGMDE